MATIEPADQEAQLSVAEHLEEIRSRLIVYGVCLVSTFALCLWQNKLILGVLNEPLPPSTTEPVTLSVAEPFMTTLAMCGYAAIILTLPIALFQVYRFLAPALSSRERRTVLPLVALIPILFVTGVLFGYYFVIPSAFRFLLGFNASEFNIQVRAREYYNFEMLTLFVTGGVFQEPVGIVALVRLGITTPARLRRQRPKLYLANLVLAVLLPGTDPVTLVLLFVPLVLLLELGILLASIFGGATQEGDQPESRLQNVLVKARSGVSRWRRR